VGQPEAGILPAPHVPRIAALLLAVAVAVAAVAGFGDGPTYDEGVHVLSGLTALRTGDFRLNPEHPPLVKLWASLPLALRGTPIPPADAPGWTDGDTYLLARGWLSEQVDGVSAVRLARVPMLLVLAGFLALVFTSVRTVLGPRAALLALAAAALDPLVLGHGRLVTTDVAAALAIQGTLVAFSSFLGRPTLERGLLFGLAVGVASVTKFSWLLSVPALAAMGLVWLARRPRERVGGGGDASSPSSPSLRGRLLLLGAAAAGAATVAGASIWAAYGFRFEPYRGRDAATAVLRSDANAGGEPAKSRAEGWRIVREDWATGRTRDGALVLAVDRARELRALPEPYLFGLAYVDRWSRHRTAFLRGELSTQGWASYFPVAFAVKTPVATLLLLVLGVVALAVRRTAIRPEGRLLFLGMAVFAVSWLGVAVAGNLDIGLRHLLPAYPFLFAVTGAAAALAVPGRARRAVGALLGLLVVESLLSFPNHLGHFNVVAGGSGRGREWLADSNVDWGQDLLRLRTWCDARASRSVRVAVDPALPLPRGFRPGFLLGAPPGERLAPLDAGTYVVSVNALLGLWEPMARAETWQDPRFLENARRAVEWAAAPPGAGLPTEVVARARRDVLVLRHARLVSRLRGRREDDRIGTSFLVFELTDEEARSLSAL